MQKGRGHRGSKEKEKRFEGKEDIETDVEKEERGEEQHCFSLKDREITQKSRKALSESEFPMFYRCVVGTGSSGFLVDML